jgi:uncharacterized membrane protein
LRPDSAADDGQPQSGGADLGRSPALDRFARAVTEAARGVARHWLLLALVACGAYIGLAVAAPVLAMTGHGRAAGWIYFVYRAACHQLPHRSWFIGGSAATHNWATVRAYLGLGQHELLGAFHHPIDDPVLGYQLALCERDMATFGALWLAMLGFAFARRRWSVPALPIRLYGLSLVPIAVDGLTQLVGLRESTPLLRTITGGLFGLATAWLVLPQLDAGFREVGATGPAACDDGST